jgi:hypothetical protein
MTRLRLAALLAVIAAASPLGADDRPPCLASGIEQVNEGAFDAGGTALDACIESLAAGLPESARSLTDAYFYKGVAFVGLRQEEGAKAAFRKVLEYDPAFEPSAEAFPPKVVRVFKAAREGKTKSVINPPSTTAKKARLGASSIAAIAGGVVVVGGGAAALVGQASPTATATATATPGPTATPTEMPTAEVFCPDSDRQLPAPSWASVVENEVVSGTKYLRCAPPRSVSPDCFVGIAYFVFQDGLYRMGAMSPHDANYIYAWDTTQHEDGLTDLWCIVQGRVEQGGYVDRRWVTIQNHTATPTAAATATPTPTPTSPPCSQLPPPSWLSPLANETVSGTVAVQCEGSAGIDAGCYDTIFYSGPGLGTSADPDSAVQWDTTQAPDGPADLVCQLGLGSNPIPAVFAVRSVTVQNATPTATPNPDVGLRSRTERTKMVTWTSALSSTGAKAQVWHDGALALIQTSGQQTVSVASDRPVNTIVGELLDGQGAGAIWTFRFHDGFKPGSLKPQSGNVAHLLADTIVFRLGGKKGERVAFTFETAPR